jgi:N-carbamoyl-L-amino-acid hydrolase
MTTTDATAVGGRDNEAAELQHSFSALFAELAEIGRRPDGSYDRLAWTTEDALARKWFANQASRLGARFSVDRNGNLWAWWGSPDGPAIATGSHLDTVLGGGAYDGALGVVAGFVALEHLLRFKRQPRRPVAVVAFADEEGARFGIPTFGSRLMTGQLQAEDVRCRADPDGISVEEALRAASVEADGLGLDDALLPRLSAFIEVHIEQGTDLADLDRPLALGHSVWPHGRWKLSLAGEGNHAGTARMRDRHDPLLVAAQAIELARQVATQWAVFATVGKISVLPNSTNSVAGTVDLWLDLRASNDSVLDQSLADWFTRVREAARVQSVELEFNSESRSGGITFDQTLCQLISDSHGEALPVLSTAAGHDAAVLGQKLRTAMIFVRNSTGVSHAPRERAAMEDCAKAAGLLSRVIGRLAFDQSRNLPPWM